jgi:VWFA-related protein
MQTTRVLAVTVGVLLIPSALGAQPSGAQTHPDSRLSITTTAVMVDVVVRDRRGRPVTDLSADDFELYESGVQQSIASFRLVSRGVGFAIVAPRSDAEPRFAGPYKVADPEEEPGLLALVFDRLTPDARARAGKAAARYVDEAKLPGDRIGVFAVDPSLRTVLPFTDDEARIRTALASTSTHAATDLAANSARIQELRRRQETLELQQVAAQEQANNINFGNAETSQAVGATLGGAAADQLLDQMEIRMAQTYQTLDRDHGGHRTTNGLLALLNSLRAAPGRKTVVFFSEGLALPPAAVDRFRSVIDLANRANVAIYTMDTAGLRVESTLEETRREVMAFAEERLRQNASGTVSYEGAMTKALERNEDLLRSNPHASLGRLADETGGFFIRDTNDLPGGLRRIDEDMRFHYLLTYTPTDQEYDGRWREIAVKVRRSDLQVRARKGYFALREMGPEPVLAHEAPALAILDGTSIPNAFPMRALALAFPDPARPGLVPVVVQVRTDALTFQVDEEQHEYVTDFAIVTRIKDASGRVIRKMSQQYQLTGPVEQLLPAKVAGEVTFYRDPVLEPGVYTLEALVYDAPSGRASARIATIEVPPGGRAELQASSLVIVRRSEEVPEAERDPGNPLYYGDLLLYPNLGEPVSKAMDKEVSFFITVYPGRHRGRLGARLQLLQDGRPLATAPIEIDDPDPEGRVQQTGRLPLEPLPPGRYELVFTVADGKEQLTRDASFTVVP